MYRLMGGGDEAGECVVQDGYKSDGFLRPFVGNQHSSLYQNLVTFCPTMGNQTLHHGVQR